MAQSIKLGSDTYLDWSGVTVDNSGTTLQELWDNRIKYSDITATNSLTIPANGVALASGIGTSLNGKHIVGHELIAVTPSSVNPQIASVGLFHGGDGIGQVYLLLANGYNTALSITGYKIRVYYYD